MRNRKYTSRVGKDAAIFMAAVMEYLSAEELEIVGEVCLERGHKRI